MQPISSDVIKKIEFNLLVCFRELCEKNNLYYTLCGGTLLGAVRHKGFIPWDDDIDVLMPRPDYERLLNDRDIDKSMLPDYYQIVNWKNESHDYPFIKVVDTRTKIEIPYLGEKFHPKSLWIDVFPIDGNPDNEKELAKLYKKAIFIRKLVLLKTANPAAGKSKLKKALKPILVAGVKLLNKRGLCDKLDAVAKSYSFEEHDLIGGVLWGYGPQERISKKEYLTPKKVEFEGELFNAPSNYDAYLRGLYGDYMKLPPIEKRVTHEMTCYIESEVLI